MLRAGFCHRQTPDAVKVFVFNRRFPASPRLIGFFDDDVFHDFLPGARAQFEWIKNDSVAPVSR
jgi:hypothetical protein